MITFCLFISMILFQCTTLESHERIGYSPNNLSFDFRGVRYYADRRYPELTFLDYSTMIYAVEWDQTVIFRDKF